MARILKDGTYKPAPSAAKRSERMSGSIQFQDALRKGTNVKVFMGAGWEKGVVVQWEKSRCTVRLNRGNKTVVCHDARNLQTL
jgi:sRNA-binding protein